MATGTTLIVGSAGFLGRQLVRTLLERGSLVAGFDVAPDPELACHPGYAFAAGDVAAFAPPSGVDGVETVIYLAQSPRYREFPEGAEDVFRVNVAGVARLLEWARTAGCRRFVLASTGSVYAAGPDGHRIDESSPLRLDGMYVASKYSSELIAGYYSPFFELDLLRPFFLYGQGQRGMMIPGLIARIDRGEPVTLEGKDDGMRFTPLYLDDAAALVAALVEVEPVVGRSEIYNLGGTETVSIRDLAETIGAALGRPVRYKRSDRPPRHFLADSSKLYAAAGFRPSVPLAEGIRRAVAAFRSQQFPADEIIEK